jgi:hypothetical protein
LVGLVGRVVMLATLVALLAPPALAQAHKRNPKPDLVIEHGTVTAAGGLYLFQNDPDPNVSLNDTTANDGAARAGRTVTRVYLEHAGRRWLLAEREVPPLRPGRSDGGSDLLVHETDFPLGAYTLKFCADAANADNESSRKSHCRSIDTSDFFVAAHGWIGTLSGDAITPTGFTENWYSSPAALTANHYEGNGTFSYAFNGTVSWADHGTDSMGCTYTGAGSHTFNTQNPAEGVLTIDYKHEEFNADINAPATGYYQINDSCPPPHGPGPIPGPFTLQFWGASEGTPIALPFGATSLPGSPSRAVDTTFTWNLRAAGP